ncbi:hypothetical protein EJ08DRAFT_725189 [Tothia fuscella]|uniref:Uncharacterized protein n=1 Tax=Tothia fuscella TaxID=1048955 RepID=A0A9P4TUK2_9PEZI|nr:hypothetical protein EJ08DRAFT_725189 [Tothia fuscella]
MLRFIKLAKCLAFGDLLRGYAWSTDYAWSTSTRRSRTADFKRVGKRSQQVELKRNNEILQQKNDGLELESVRTQQQLADLRQEQYHLRRQLTEQNRGQTAEEAEELWVFQSPRSWNDA